MKGRTWKNIEKNASEEIKSYLSENGGTSEEVKSLYEEWRIRFSDSTFTYYTKGTLFSTPSPSNDPAVYKAWKKIDSLVGFTFSRPKKDFLMGLDETGKGEIIGHTVLAGVIFPKGIFEKVDLLVGPADTKKRHTFEYWDKIFEELDHFRSSGFDFITEKISPSEVDRYNFNRIMDVRYQRILSLFLQKVKINQCRIVLDDYGVGTTLNRFLNSLTQKGAEVIITKKAEDKYLGAKVASLVSKRIREKEIREINENPDYQINGLSIGSGNAGDKQTLDWLRKWHAAGKEWPWFIKRSFKTIWEMEGKTKSHKKINPPSEKI
ncbi:MAG TPA: hypothetical protein VMW81_02005 [Nitrospinota bacterium]|nr:hypothetical protein [Nitrospinota bacterium]